MFDVSHGWKSALDSVKSSVQSSYKTVDDIDDDVKAISKARIPVTNMF